MIFGRLLPRFNPHNRGPPETPQLSPNSAISGKGFGPAETRRTYETSLPQDITQPREAWF